MSKQMALDCISIMGKRMSGLISMEEYYIGLKELDKKYPHLPRRSVPLTADQMRNYRGTVIIRDETTGKEYYGNFQPLNFSEAAEMLMHHRSAVNDGSIRERDQVALTASLRGEPTAGEWQNMKRKAKREPEYWYEIDPGQEG